MILHVKCVGLRFQKIFTLNIIEQLNSSFLFLKKPQQQYYYYNESWIYWLDKEHIIARLTRMLETS